MQRISRTVIALLVLGVVVSLGAVLVLRNGGRSAPAAVMTPAAATSPEAGIPPSVPQALRIENIGNEPIRDLIVVSPKDRITFGDVPAGESSEYQIFPDGVYRYSAYEYSLDGRTVIQYVMDWMGEVPMDGATFTYRIRLDLGKRPGGQIELVEVVKDS